MGAPPLPAPLLLGQDEPQGSPEEPMFGKVGLIRSDRCDETRPREGDHQTSPIEKAPQAIREPAALFQGNCCRGLRRLDTKVAS